MAITAASIEANGWVLRLDVTASLGGFVDYVLDAGGFPRITLASAHPGFVKSGGEAVAGSMTRSLIATKPLRKPVVWNGGGVDVFVVDEVDLGGGVIRVRVALSEHIYATDTALSLSVLAGWRTGESAASGIAVTNNSTIAAPLPIMRWALAPYEVTAGGFRVSLKVYSHHPIGFEPVAGVKFSVTDSATVKSVWTTALGTDNSYGDDLRCYTAIIDPATATALTAGVLRVDAEVYPWLGAMRPTDPAGTRLMSNIRFDGYFAAAASPWAICYDPTGTRYGSMFTFVDPVNGTTAAVAGMVQPTLAAAKAIAPASRPRNIQTATQAGYLFNRTLPAANGQTAVTRSIDGMNVVLAAGVHSGLGTSNVTAGTVAEEVPLRVVGDPADSNPRSNCIIQTATSGITRHNRTRWQNLTIEAGSVALAGSGMTINLVDNVTLRGKAGQEGNAVAPFAAAPFATGLWNTAVTRSRWWRFGAGAGSGSNRVGLFRANEHSRAIGSFTVAVKNRLIGDVEDGFVGSAALPIIYGPWPAPGVLAQAEDFICADNNLRFLRGRAWQPLPIAAATAGTPGPSIRRQVFAGNIVERIGTAGVPFMAIGEDNLTTMSYNIIEGNTFVGDRANLFYSDPLPTSLAQANTLLNQAFVNRVANNAFDWMPTKHDAFFDSTTAGLRGNGNGYRPHMVDAWSMLYGVCHEGNLLTERAAQSPGEFGLEFQGVRTANGYGGILEPLFTDDRSIAGPLGAAAAGGGNYRPQAGSPAAGRGVRANSDVDADGVARPLAFDAGAFQTPLVLLVPAAGRSLTRAGPALIDAGSLLLPANAGTPHHVRSASLEPGLIPASTVRLLLDGGANLAWAAAVDPERGAHPKTTGATALTFSNGLAAAAAGMAQSATSPSLNVEFSLSPSSASSALASSAIEVEPIRLTVVLAADGRLSVHATSPLLLVPGAIASATLVIGPDPRTLIPDHN